MNDWRIDFGVTAEESTDEAAESKHYRSSRWRCNFPVSCISIKRSLCIVEDSVKEVLLKFRKIHRTTPAPESAPPPATLLKRDSSTGVFLWILRNF